MSRSKSSAGWLREHFNDEYVKKAQAEGLRSRAAYKLEEVLARDRVLRPGAVVVDLGAAPGGWSQLVRRQLGDSGSVFALDILPMQEITGVDFLQGDFREQAVLQDLEQRLAGRQVDLVLSDMAPNMSGMALPDQIRAMALAELALDFSRQWLKPGGSFLVKLFQGVGFDEYLRGLRTGFSSVTMRKPKASRARSREVYALATGRRPAPMSSGENRA
ncbi:MAG: 23S rRNA (uridine(2552)-2'-O)-methyltransferase RlmE [Xanthomonadales bacterium]|nr:23S rRNA (uridine(2552)-2'-O)-methyltransferase RlmE [Xanthomonadales bacterium]